MQRIRRVWLIALVGYVLLSAGWALALPTNATYDEEDHALRAYAVASGQVYADGDAVRVPRSLLPDNVDCTWERDDAKSAACQRPISDQSRALTPSTAARYSPVYYFPVGLPLLARPDHTGIVLARLVSGLLTGLLLASAFAVAAWLRRPLLLAGLALANTPMLFNLAGAINPNGLEIAAGTSLWVALLGLLLAEETGPRLGDVADRAVQGMVLLASVSAALLITVRQLGPLLLAISVLCCVLLARRDRVRALLRRPDLRRAGGVLVAGATVFFGVWTATSRIADPAPAPKVTHPMQLSLYDALHGVATIRVPFYARQLVGQFSYGETHLPGWLTWGWQGMVIAVVLAAAALAGWRYRLVVLGLFGSLLGLLAVLELYFLPHSGWFSHSRYAMPAGVGLLLLPAFASQLPAFVPRLSAVPRRWLTRLPAVPDQWLTWMVRTVAVVTGLFGLVALAVVASRFQSGPAAPVNPFTGAWLPPTGPVPPLLALAGGATLIGTLTWRLAAQAALLNSAGRPTGPPEGEAATREPASGSQGTDQAATEQGAATEKEAERA
ncbi:MAG: DUF2142 domain-containing protein [Micromonosporaceae bacterium]